MGIQTDRSRAISTNQTKVHRLSPPSSGREKIKCKQNLEQEFPRVKSEFSIMLGSGIGFLYYITVDKASVTFDTH